jgi:hypothetical protein
MAVVFLEGLSPIPKQMASTKCHHGPRRTVCQFAHCQARGLTNPKRNRLLNIDFLAACDTTVRLKYHGKQQSKNNNDVVKN